MSQVISAGRRTANDSVRVAWPAILSSSVSQSSSLRRSRCRVPQAPLAALRRPGCRVDVLQRRTKRAPEVDVAPLDPRSGAAGRRSRAAPSDQPSSRRIGVLDRARRAVTAHAMRAHPSAPTCDSLGLFSSEERWAAGGPGASDRGLPGRRCLAPSPMTGSLAAWRTTSLAGDIGRRPGDTFQPRPSRMPELYSDSEGPTARR